MAYGHKQVTIIHPEFGGTEVDEGIAELLQLLWNREIETTLSCQENFPDIIWIEFYRAEDIELFLDLLFAEKDSNSKLADLYARIFYDDEPDWQFDTVLENWNYRIENDEIVETGKPSFVASISLRFPISDYPLILKTFKDM